MYKVKLRLLKEQFLHDQLRQNSKKKVLIHRKESEKKTFFRKILYKQVRRARCVDDDTRKSGCF